MLQTTSKQHRLPGRQSRAKKNLRHKGVVGLPRTTPGPKTCLSTQCWRAVAMPTWAWPKVSYGHAWCHARRPLLQLGQKARPQLHPAIVATATQGTASTASTPCKPYCRVPSAPHHRIGAEAGVHGALHPAVVATARRGMAATASSQCCNSIRGHSCAASAPHHRIGAEAGVHDALHPAVAATATKRHVCNSLPGLLPPATPSFSSSSPRWC